MPAAPPGPASVGLPIRAAFFYPWYPQAWRSGQQFPYSNYLPADGYYDSTTSAVVSEQMSLATCAGLDAMIASWWGPDHHTDTALRSILAGASDALRWAVYYEAEGAGDPNVDELRSDLDYLAETFFFDASYLWVGGRPVLFAYADGSDAQDMTARWEQAIDLWGGEVYLVLKVFPGYRSDASGIDAWHQYAPARAYDEQLPWAVTISPGFWKVGEEPRLARDVERFRADAVRMASSGAQWQLITTWNEWGEGTSIEPADEWATAYVDALSEALGGPGSC